MSTETAIMFTIVMVVFSIFGFIRLMIDIKMAFKKSDDKNKLKKGGNKTEVQREVENILSEH